MTCELETTRVYSCCLFERISDCEESLQFCLALQGREIQACWESLLLTLLSSVIWAWLSWSSLVLPHEASLSLKDHRVLSRCPLFHFWFLYISWFCFNLGFVCFCALFVSFVSFVIFILCMCIFACIYEHAPSMCLWWSKERLRSPGITAVDSSVLPCGCWELNLCPLQVQLLLLPAEPSVRAYFAF